MAERRLDLRIGVNWRDGSRELKTSRLQINEYVRGVKSDIATLKNSSIPAPKIGEGWNILQSAVNRRVSKVSESIKEIGANSVKAPKIIGLDTQLKLVQDSTGKMKRAFQTLGESQETAAKKAAGTNSQLRSKEAAAVRRLEREYRAGSLSVEAYTGALETAAKTGVAGSEAQIAALIRLRSVREKEATAAEASSRRVAAAERRRRSDRDRNIERAAGFAGRAGNALSLGVTAPILLGGREAVQEASGLVEAMNKANVVFDTSSAKVQKWSETTAEALGVSRREALESSSTFGNLFRAMQFTSAESSDMSIRLVQLASDLASFNNSTPEEALQSLRSGLVGEIEPLRRFGVQLSAARVEAEAYSSGIAKTNVNLPKLKANQFAVAEATMRLNKATKEHGANSYEALKATNQLEKAQAILTGTLKGSKTDLTAAQKAQAAYNIILKDTTLAHGDFHRTAGDYANTMRSLNAAWQDAIAALGKELLPIIKEGAKWLTTLLKNFNELTPAQQENTLKWIAIAAAAGPALKLLEGGITIFGGLAKAGDAISKLGTAKNLSDIGGAAGGAATKAGGLLSTLKGLAALGVITAEVYFLITTKWNGKDSFESMWKDIQDANANTAKNQEAEKSERQKAAHNKGILLGDLKTLERFGRDTTPEQRSGMKVRDLPPEIWDIIRRRINPKINGFPREAEAFYDNTLAKTKTDLDLARKALDTTMRKEGIGNKAAGVVVQDAKAGPVNSPLIQDLKAAASLLGYRIEGTSGIESHSKYVKGTKTISKHKSGSALDINTINGVSFNSDRGEFTKLGFELEKALVGMGYPARDTETKGGRGLLWQTMKGGNHYNHLHVSNAAGMAGGGRTVGGAGSGTGIPTGIPTLPMPDVSGGTLTGLTGPATRAGYAASAAGRLFSSSLSTYSDKGPSMSAGGRNNLLYALNRQNEAIQKKEVDLAETRYKEDMRRAKDDNARENARAEKEVAIAEARDKYNERLKDIQEARARVQIEALRADRDNADREAEIRTDNLEVRRKELSAEEDNLRRAADETTDGKEKARLIQEAYKVRERAILYEAQVSRIEAENRLRDDKGKADTLTNPQARGGAISAAYRKYEATLSMISTELSSSLRGLHADSLKDAQEALTAGYIRETDIVNNRMEAEARLLRATAELSDNMETRHRLLTQAEAIEEDFTGRTNPDELDLTQERNRRASQERLSSMSGDAAGRALFSAAMGGGSDMLSQARGAFGFQDAVTPNGGKSDLYQNRMEQITSAAALASQQNPKNPAVSISSFLPDIGSMEKDLLTREDYPGLLKFRDTVSKLMLEGMEAGLNEFDAKPAKERTAAYGVAKHAISSGFGGLDSLSPELRQSLLTAVETREKEKAPEKKGPETETFFRDLETMGRQYGPRLLDVILGKGNRDNIFRSFWNDLVNVGASNAMKIASERFLNPVMKRLTSGLESVMGSGIAGISRIALMMNASIAGSGAMGKKRKKGGNAGKVLGAVAGSLIPGVGLMAGIGYGGSLGSAVAGGNIGEIGGVIGGIAMGQSGRSGGGGAGSAITAGGRERTGTRAAMTFGGIPGVAASGGASAGIAAALSGAMAGGGGAAGAVYQYNDYGAKYEASDQERTFRRFTEITKNARQKGG